MLIHSYQENWADDFKKIKEVILETLGDKVLAIEHVGSTAIKHLAAKPIIDLDVVHAGNIPFDEIKKGLEQLDYDHNGDQGIPGREVFKRNKLKAEHPVLDSVKHHLYVCQVGSAELQRHLLFRNYLRTHEQERMAYEQLKYEIAALANQDSKIYATWKERMAKTFVEAILNKAKAVGA